MSPASTKVARCVKNYSRRKVKGEAIAVCQKTTGESYKTGRKKK